MKVRKAIILTKNYKHCLKSNKYARYVKTKQIRIFKHKIKINKNPD
jgi:hypothetical protein